jgi:hypothetical protein
VIFNIFIYPLLVCVNLTFPSYPNLLSPHSSLSKTNLFLSTPLIIGELSENSSSNDPGASPGLASQKEYRVPECAYTCTVRCPTKNGSSAYSSGVFSLKKCRHRSVQMRHPESAERQRLAMSGWWVLVSENWMVPK